MKQSFLKKNIKLFGIILLVITLIFIGTRGLGNAVRGSLFFITNPVLKTSRGFAEGFRGLFQFLGSIGALKDDNEKLIAENLALTAENTRLVDVEKENRELRKEVGLLPQDKYDLLAADITAEDSLGSSGSFLLDKGSISGLQEGMPVIIENGVLIGRISQVFPDSARVTLVTNRDSAVNGEILESGAKGIVKGTYGLGIMIDMISQTEEVKNGDTVITSGLGGGTPRGLFIGKIGQINQSEDKLFQQATVVSPVMSSSLRIAFVIKNF
jgi:rod shape-determining protein MreC